VLACNRAMADAVIAAPFFNGVEGRRGASGSEKEAKEALLRRSTHKNKLLAIQTILSSRDARNAVKRKMDCLHVILATIG
jgi:hypothetical protein